MDGLIVERNARWSATRYDVERLRPEHVTKDLPVTFPNLRICFPLVDIGKI